MGWVSWLLFVVAQALILIAWLIAVSVSLSIKDYGQVKPPVAAWLYVGATAATALDGFLIWHRGWPPARTTDVEVILIVLATFGFGYAAHHYAKDAARTFSGFSALLLIALFVAVFLNVSWLPRLDILSPGQGPRVAALTPSPNPSSARPTPTVSVSPESPTPTARPTDTLTSSPSVSPSSQIAAVLPAPPAGGSSPGGSLGGWILIVCAVVTALGAIITTLITALKT
jgi:hypothetical protein